MTDMRSALKQIAAICDRMAGRDNRARSANMFDVADIARAALSSPAPERLSEEERRAVENLRTHQEQCDMDGVMVKVSRQAVDETLAIIDRLSRQPEEEPVAFVPTNSLVALTAPKRMTTALLFRSLDFVDEPSKHTALYTSPRLDREKVARAVTIELEQMHKDGVPICMREGETIWRTYFAGFDLSRFAQRIADAIMREVL